MRKKTGASRETVESNEGTTTNEEKKGNFPYTGNIILNLLWKNEKTNMELNLPLLWLKLLYLLLGKGIQRAFYYITGFVGISPSPFYM